MNTEHPLKDVVQFDVLTSDPALKLSILRRIKARMSDWGADANLYINFQPVDSNENKPTPSVYYTFDNHTQHVKSKYINAILRGINNTMLVGDRVVYILSHVNEWSN